MRCVGHYASLTFLAFGQVEINCDLGVDFNRVSIQEIRPVAPLLYCFDCGLRQQRQPALHSNISDGAVLADHGHPHYGSFNPSPARLWWILWRNVVDQIRLGQTRGNTHSLWCRGGGWREDGGSSTAMQQVAEHSTGNSADYSARNTSNYPARRLRCRRRCFLRRMHSNWNPDIRRRDLGNGRGCWKAPDIGSCGRGWYIQLR